MAELPTGTVTFLFTDIEGSTNPARAMGALWREVLEQHNSILRRAIRDHGGIERRTEGDAFFAVFSSAVDAVAATAAAQRAIEHASVAPGRIDPGPHGHAYRRGSRRRRERSYWRPCPRSCRYETSVNTG